MSGRQTTCTSVMGEREGEEESELTADSTRTLCEGRGEKVLFADDSGRGGTVHDNLRYKHGIDGTISIERERVGQTKSA